MQTRTFLNRKAITRVARWLLELVYPLCGFASTPERRRYWRALPLRRAAKLFAAVFFVLAGVPFFIDALSTRSYPLAGLIAISAVTGVLKSSDYLASNCYFFKTRRAHYPKFSMP